MTKYSMRRVCLFWVGCHHQVGIVLHLPITVLLLPRHYAMCRFIRFMMTPHAPNVKPFVVSLFICMLNTKPA